MNPFFLRSSAVFRCLIGVFLWLGILKPSFAENPFRDVPPDHFAYKAINQLLENGLMQGYPDGTFKGRRVLSRYEFAVILAKILAKIEAEKEVGKPSQLSADTTFILDKLSSEFSTELDMLGVRVDSLEKRVEKVESDTKALDMALSNVHLDGFYQGSQQYIFRKNEWVDFQEPGLHKLSQDIFLRFLGNPKASDEGFSKDLEAFVELKANLSGVASQRLEYDFSDQPEPGDEVDDFATGILDERKVMVNKAHFKSKAKLMNLRVFMGEQFTDLRDPASLLTASVWRVNPANGIFSGIEADGKLGDWSYFTSVLKRTQESSDPGGDLESLFSKFSKATESSDDVFSFRTTFQPWESVTLGASMVEHAFNFDKRDDFNRILGWDTRFQTKGDSTFSLTLNHLISEGRGDTHGTAFKTDLQFETKKLLLTLKTYDFDPDFQTSVSSGQFIDTGDGNYGKGDSKGEKLLRLTSKYSFKEGDLAYLNSLDSTFTGQIKWWEGTLGSEFASWYGRNGTLLSLFTVADFHREPVMFQGEMTDMPAQIQLTNEIKKDAKKGEKGRLRHKLAGGMKVFPFLGFRGFVEHISDLDDIQLEKNFTRLTTALEMIGGLHKRLLYKNRIVDRIDFPNRLNEIDVNIWYSEWTWDVLKGHSLGDAALKLFYQNFKVNVAAFRDASFVEDSWVTELNMNFSKKLEARTFYGWQLKRNLDGVGDDFWNWFGEISYEPTASTEIALTYGDDYSNEEQFKFKTTRQRLTLKVQSDF
jgi:hypothetical protein